MRLSHVPTQHVNWIAHGCGVVSLQRVRRTGAPSTGGCHVCPRRNCRVGKRVVAAVAKRLSSVPASRKGRARESASYYYSLPHLRVKGTVTREGQPLTVSGSAWLDHEWSSQYLEKDAIGWDWIGINLEGGGALMAFRMRDKAGASHWAGGTLRRPDGTTRVFSPSEVRFAPRREWRSARTGASYPVSWVVRAGDLELAIEPLFDDQEHDTRATSGTIYWEGAVRALRDGKLAGLGYLELTGYWRRLDL